MLPVLAILIHFFLNIYLSTVIDLVQLLPKFKRRIEVLLGTCVRMAGGDYICIDCRGGGEQEGDTRK